MLQLDLYCHSMQFFLPIVCVMTPPEVNFVVTEMYVPQPTLPVHVY